MDLGQTLLSRSVSRRSCQVVPSTNVFSFNISKPYFSWQQGISGSLIQKIGLQRRAQGSTRHAIRIPGTGLKSAKSPPSTPVGGIHGPYNPLLGSPSISGIWFHNAVTVSEPKFRVFSSHYSNVASILKPNTSALYALLPFPALSHRPILERFISA
jgi:hypothetical protein